MPPTRAALRFLATLASGYLFLAPQGQLDPPKISDSEAIQAVLKTQQAAWNRGDIAAFLKGYWDSPELTFAGSDGIVRGYSGLAERYQAHYPDRQSMGELEFSGAPKEVASLLVSSLEGAMMLARSHGDVRRFRATADRLIASLSR